MGGGASMVKSDNFVFGGFLSFLEVSYLVTIASFKIGVCTYDLVFSKQVEYDLIPQ